MASENQPRRNIWPRIALSLISLILIFILILISASMWLTMTASGARTVFIILQRLSGGALHTADINGRLIGPLSIGKLVIKNQQGKINAEQVKLEWNAKDLTAGVLHITRVHVGSLRLSLESASNEPSKILTSLLLPFRLQIDNFNLAHGYIEQDKNNILLLNDLALRLDFDGQLYALKLDKLLVKIPKSHQWTGQLEGSVELSAVSPFSTNAALNLNAVKKNGARNIQAFSKFTAIGNLSTLQTDFELKIEHEKLKTIAKGNIVINPYSPKKINNGEISFDDLNLHSLHDAFPFTKINADVRLDKNGNGEFSIKNLSPGTINNARLPIHHAEGKFKLDQRKIQLIDSQINDGIFRASGNFSEDNVIVIFTTHGLNLKKIDSRLVKTSLYTSLDLNGKVKPYTELLLKFVIKKSIINEQKISGQGKINLAEQQLKIDTLNLFAGKNTLHIHGILDKKSGDLRISIDAPDLTQLGEKFHGNLKINARVTGKIDHPSIDIKWNANQANLTKEFSIGKTAGKAKFNINKNSEFLLSQLDTQFLIGNLKIGNNKIETLNFYAKGNLKKNSDISLLLNSKNINYGSTTIKNLMVDVSGKIEDHKITASIYTEQEKIVASANGEFKEINKIQTWHGAIKEAEASGHIYAKLKKDAHISLSKNLLKLDSFAIDSNFGNFVIEYFKRDKQQISSKGNLQQVDLSKFLEFFNLKKLIKKTDLLIDGNWFFEFDENLIDTPKANFNFQRSSGDIVFQGDKPFSADLKKLNLAIKSENHHLMAKMEAEGNFLGKLTLDAETTFQKAEKFPDLNTPVNAKLKINMPSIAWAGKLISSDLIMDGSVNAELTMSGNLKEPDFDGHVNGNKLSLMFIDTGINLQAGVLDCEFSGNTINIKQLKFSGSSGSVMTSGPIYIQHGKIDANFLWLADKFTVFDSADRKLGVTGSGKIIADDYQLHVNGDLLVDHGLFDIGRADTPKLSDDVIITGQAKKTAHTLNVDLDIGIGLGQQLVLRGRGLNARLGGALRLLSNRDGSLSLFGLMQIIKGTYQAYGRELTIERGIFRFDGSPTNPALNIRAIRRGTEVEAGVAIGGNALSPRISLVSEPEVPDAEKLSWLVLGQGLYNASGAQAGTLQNTATSLLTQSAAAGVQSQIATALGLDLISVSKSQDTLQERIVTLGKRLSSRLYVSYQQGLQTASSVVLFRYTLSPRLAVEAETGNRSVFSLFYNITFD